MKTFETHEYINKINKCHFMWTSGKEKLQATEIDVKQEDSHLGKQDPSLEILACVQGSIRNNGLSRIKLNKDLAGWTHE